MADRFGSVRARVTVAATAVVFVVLVLMAVVVVQVHRSLLMSNLDESMAVSAGDLVHRVEAGQGLPTVAGFGDDDAAFQLVDGSGTVIASSPNLADQAPIVPDTSGVRTVDALPEDPTPYRVYTTSIDADGDALVLHLAATLDDVESSTDDLRRVLALTVPAVTVLLAVGIWYFVGRALRPVEAIRREVAAIGGSDLHRRVPEPRGDDEVARLARTMNDMLERVEIAGDQQRRFVSDASHELRSPLTRMRTELEVDEAHPDVADPIATQQSVLEEVVGMQQTVDDLLLLARRDAGQPMAMEPLALDELVRSEADGADVSAVEPVTVQGNREALRRLLRNLLDNAGRHARTGVRVELRRHGTDTELAVLDDGPGIPESDRERIFERFTRLDDARSTRDGGTGLGLAIVREVAEAHGGHVGVDPTVTQGTRIVVTLP